MCMNVGIVLISGCMLLRLSFMYVLKISVLLVLGFFVV